MEYHHYYFHCPKEPFIYIKVTDIPNMKWSTVFSIVLMFLAKQATSRVTSSISSRSLSESSMFQSFPITDRLRHLQCLENVLQADRNQDWILDRSEYAHFVQLQEKRNEDYPSEVVQDAHPFSDLKLKYVSLFYTLACMSCHKKTEDEQCCVGSSARLDLTPTEPREFASSVVYLCSSLDGIGNEVAFERRD